ncbi:DUF1080 domain-containing protein [Telluribacter sp.]|jgi:hypothetical protein|uniref:3-keto-disaccharide hydrolase n=1 Tax=Telluribacter sp. TaxID=1978767 RepID=UPI002E12F7BB|nr:DUF1080 domain-containing protein [Telluribacter sp.]
MKKPILLLLSFLVLTVLSAGFSGSEQPSPVSTWQSLFNGKNLRGWGTYLLPSRAAADQTPIGLNKDPHGVFKVENGMIRVSGQDWGGVFTEQSYGNYHLRYQVKFGKEKWAPRQNAVADGGLLFHCSLPYDYGSKCWMRSIEMQIQETDIGDYHNVGAGVPQLAFSPAKDDADEVNQYDPLAPLQPTDKRVFRSGNFESAPDQWTTGELVARGADAVFIVNGFVVNRLYNIYRADLQEQTTGGQIQFQSEGAEHFLRNIELRPVNFVQVGRPKLVSTRQDVKVSEKEIQTLEIQNQGEAVELIAAELIGKELEQFSVKLPAFPLVLKKGEKLKIPVSAKAGSKVGNKVKFRLETVLGPVPDFAVNLQVQ